MNPHAFISVSVNAAVPANIRGCALLFKTASGVVILVLHVEYVRMIRIWVRIVIVS